MANRVRFKARGLSALMGRVTIKQSTVSKTVKVANAGSRRKRKA